MNVCTALETNAETTEVMQPGMRAFNDPAIFSKAAAMFGAALGDNRLDTAIAQRASMPLRVVTAIGVDHARSLQWVAAQPTNWRNRIDQRQQLRDIVNVRAGQDRRERRAIGVGDDVVLRDGIKKTPMGAVNLFGKLLTFGHLNNWSQGWARRLLRTTCGH